MTCAKIALKIPWQKPQGVWYDWRIVGTLEKNMAASDLSSFQVSRTDSVAVTINLT